VSSIESPLRAAARRRLAVGAFGERVAASVLAARGVRIVDRNVRSGRGEVDLVCDVDGERVAIEVKTLVARRSDDDPLIHFDHVKLARVRAAGLRLEPRAYRIDVVGVTIWPDRVDVRWVPRVG
jgi:Holliday junction resolvase-like predicted endonuclease